MSSKEQLARVAQEEAQEMPATQEAHEEFTPEKVSELAASKETALDELKERGVEETKGFESGFAQSAQGLGGTPEDIAPVTAQIEQLEAKKEETIESARKEISAEAEAPVEPEMPNIVAPEQSAVTGPEAANENDPEALAKLQGEKARALGEQMSGLTGEETAAFVTEYNKNNPDSLKGQEFRLMRSDGETMFVVNERGSLEALSVNKENAREILAQIKTKDELLKGKSYELRKAILEKSEGGIVTHEAYTYGDVPQGNALDAYLDNPENWVAERRALHEQIVTEEYGKAAALSERLNDEEPTIYALRGNTAAGKTTAVRNNEIFAKALDAKGQPSGAINPDTYKGELKSTEAVEGRQAVGHQQTHEEGSMLARKISEKITNSESSMVIDKRMNKEKNITELINTAEKSGKKIKILDVDVPFEVSLVRVLGREVGGEDPTVPFGAVAEGFEGVRKNRASLLEKVANDPKIKDYVLMVADEKGNSVKVAEKIDGKLVILEGREDAFQRAVDKGTESSVEAAAKTVIDDEYVAKIMDRTPDAMHSKVRASLERYKGRTLKEALDEHSSKLNPE
jgi:hypothetical protein